MKIQDGDTALITGASRGIGQHIALALANRGMNLVLAARSQSGLDAVAAEARAANVTVTTLTVDLGNRTEASKLIGRAEEEAGPIDVLVNNAGIEATGCFDEVAPDDLATMTDVNLLAPMLLTRAVLPGMLDRGRGHVVNIASIAGVLAAPYQEPYSATKFGLVGFTRSLRLTAQDRGWGVSASAICPGFMEGAGMYADMKQQYGVEAPRTVGTLPVEQVGVAVIKAIEHDLAEVLIMKGAPRLMVTAANVSPRLFERVTRRVNIAAPFRTVAEQRTPTSP